MAPGSILPPEDTWMAPGCVGQQEPWAFPCTRPPCSAGCVIPAGIHSRRPSPAPKQVPHARLSITGQAASVVSLNKVRSFRKGKEKFSLEPSHAFTLRIPKTAKSEATLQHRGSMLLEAEQSSLEDRPTWWSAPGCLLS